MKFGGAALANVDRIKEVAQKIAAKLACHTKILVVVSAMEGMTDTLLGLAQSVHPNPPARECDMLVSVGERISMALLAMALDTLGVKALSLTGSQSGIITCTSHNQARITDVRPQRIRDAFLTLDVVIVAGFQGVSLAKEITTLGRGGSDTTAVALAIALKADRVEFYKDVPGVYSGDPKVSSDAKFLPSLSYEQALEVIDGCQKKILHPRAINLAAKHAIALHVLTFHSNEPMQTGTVIHAQSTVSSHQYVYEV